MTVSARIAPLPDTQRAEFGRRLHALRRARGWTLAELSERSGLAVSTISKAERGLMSLTYDRMLQLARGIGVDMAEFFAADGTAFAPGSFAVASKGNFERLETRNYVYEMLFPQIRNKAMVPMMGSEDFAYMLQARPGAYLFLGAGEGAGLHHPQYDFNDEIAPIGASFFARLVERAQPIA